MKLQVLKSKKLGPYLLIILGVILFFVARRMSLYLFFIIGTGFMTYIKKIYHLPVDITPLFFLEIVITRYYGLIYTLIFIFLAYVIPAVLSGGGMKLESYAFVGVSIIANIMSLFMGTLEIQMVGYLTSTVQYIGGTLIGMISKPLFVSAADGLANVTNNLMWFLIFTDVVVWLLGG